MKSALTKRPTITVEMLRKDRTVRPEITGLIRDGLIGDVSCLRGDVTGLSGYVSGLRGDVTGLSGYVTSLSGYVTGLSGDVSGLRGDVDLCDISQADREAGIDIETLVLPA